MLHPDTKDKLAHYLNHIDKADLIDLLLPYHHHGTLDGRTATQILYTEDDIMSLIVSALSAGYDAGYRKGLKY